MRKATTQAKYTYRLVRAELWGNAKDGFDTNDWHKVAEKDTSEELSLRYLLRWTRDYFTGCSFAWNEAKSRPMSREGIEVNGIDEVMWFFGRSPEGMDIIGSAQVTYRGHYVGEIQLFQRMEITQKVEVQAVTILDA